MRSQNRVTGLNASFTVTDGSPNPSICCSTGSGMRRGERVAGEQQHGQRLAWATAAAVIMFVAPGPIELVATMIRRRRDALAKATAASAMPCSFWPRQVGNTSRTSSSAGPRHVTLPWPKMAKAPGKSGCTEPSMSICWAIR